MKTNLSRRGAVTLVVTLLLILVLALKPSSGADSDDVSSFSALFKGFLYETSDVTDGHSADQFVERLLAVHDPEDPRQRLQMALVSCHYTLRNDANERLHQGGVGAEQAIAADLPMEAALFKLCQALGARDQTNPAAALPFIEQSLALAETTDNHYVIGLIQSALADTRNAAEQFGPAMTSLLAAHASFQAADRQDRAAVLAIDMATIYRQIGHLAAAESLLLRTLESLGAEAGEDYLDAILQLGLVKSAQGRYQEAIDQLEARLDSVNGSGIPSLHRGFHAALGQAYLGLGQAEQALRHVRTAQQAHHDYNGGGRPALVILEARALLALNRYAPASERLDSIHPTMSDCGRSGLRRDWLAVRAELKAATGRHELAWQSLREARALDRDIQRELASEKIQALQAELSAREQQWARISARQTGLIDELSARTQSQQQRNQALIRGFAIVLGLALLTWGLSQARQRKKLGQLARQDELTGLLNRRGFFHAAKKLTERGDAAIMVIDLDHFKQVNDQFGHAAGDQVLVALGRLMQARSRSGDIAGRLGGEEFALLLPGLSLEQAAQVARRLCQEWSEQQFPGLPDRFRVTMTIGLAYSEEIENRDLDRMLLLADQRLYHGKRHGRNQVVGPIASHQTR